MTECTPARAARFWQRVQVGDDDECWPWQGYLAKNGRGLTSLNNRTVQVHRLAYLIARGVLPPLLRHTCDNPPCCNPRHLIAGTQAQNIQDKVDRGRQATGAKVKGFPAQAREWTKCSRGHPFDAKNTFVNAKGHRTCRTCRREDARERRKAQRANRL